MVIFIVVAFIGSAVSAAYIPYENNTESTKFSNGIGVTAFESPFSTQANSYNITIKLSNVTNFSSANYWIVYSGYTTGYGKNISKSGIKAVPMGAGNVDLYYESPPLHPDIYFYSFYYQNKSNVLAGIGPDLSYSSSLLLMLEIHYISYVILFMLEFTTGVFIARSIENSRKIRQERRAQ
ncbi:MAG: hypothetical protein M1148_02435 [Candidatus Thermoplasmatota archaeon]|nr:hypothetical protein [Candidatus Thermoplasmatota archaeon]